MNYALLAERTAKLIERYGRKVAIVSAPIVDPLTGNKVVEVTRDVYAVKASYVDKPIDGTIIEVDTEEYLVPYKSIDNTPVKILSGDTINGKAVKMVEYIAPDGDIIMQKVYAK